MDGPAILLIDDHEDSLIVYSTMLRHLGYRVLLAQTPDEGIRLARESRPALIFTGLFRRTETGWYTPEQLRADERTRSIPLVALTARSDMEDRSHARASGCDHFLTKPVHPSQLAAAVEVVLMAGPDEAVLEAPL